MASTSDKTVNKIAICSAIIAGFAYVGYSVVKDRLDQFRNKKESSTSVIRTGRRVYLRRLSGSEASTSTEVLLGSLESSSHRNEENQDSGFVFRALSVQDRIKELNLRARHFAETICAVQLPQEERHGRHLRLTQSLHTTPLGSPPRSLSPIDIPLFGSSRCNSVESLNHVVHREPWADAERLLDQRGDELHNRLNDLSSGPSKILTPYEAKSLVALLYSDNDDVLEKALTTILTNTAFTNNQTTLRQAKCIQRLNHLLLHRDTKIKIAVLKVISNMALNEENQLDMEFVVPSLIPIVAKTRSEELLLASLTTLVNLSVLEDWHHKFPESFYSLLYDMTESSMQEVKMQSYKLLVNLSCNETTLPIHLGANIPYKMCQKWERIASSENEEVVLRIVTYLANILPRMTEQNILESLNRYVPFVSGFMNKHPNIEVRKKSRTCYLALKSAKVLL